MRKTKIVVISAEGRDHGRQFLLTEMPAAQAERWAIRGFAALGSSGTQVSDDMRAAGMLGLLSYGVTALAGVPFALIEPLMDEMMSCVRAIPDPAHPGLVRGLVETDIEEVATILELRSEVIELHTGFSLAGALRTSAISVAASGESAGR